VKAGSSMKPQKAQVKDKGLGAESWDFRARESKVSFQGPLYGVNDAISIERCLKRKNI
jgi:hypothetical protein